MSFWSRCSSHTHGLLLALLLSSLAQAAFGQARPVPAPPKDGASAGAEQAAGEQEDNPLARQAWFLRGRLVPGQNAAALLHRAFRQKLALRQAQRQALRQAAASGGSPMINLALPWTNLGPAPITGNSTGTNNLGFTGNPEGNFSGRVSAMAVDPTDATGNTVLAGGAYGGLWKSTNAAVATASSVAWVPLFDTSPAAATLSVGAVSLQPGGTGVILVGTGEPNNAIDSYYGQGILRSADDGATWSLIRSANAGANSFQGIGFSKIAFSTDSTSLVVAGGAQTPLGNAEGLSPSTGAHSAIYTSTDSGQTWSQATAKDGANVITFARVTDVAYDHGGSVAGTPQKFYAVVAFHGFYTSSDGINWTRLTDPPGSNINTTNCPAATSTSCPLYRGELAVQPSTGDLYTVFIASGGSTTPLIYRATWTSNQVSGWTQLSNAGIVTCGDGTAANGCGASQGFYNLYIAAVPNGANTDLYFGAVNLFKCTLSSSQTCNAASGTSNIWMNITHVYGTSCTSTYQTMHPDNHAFAVVPGKTIVYFGNDGGVYRSLNETQLLGGTNCSATGPNPNGNALDSLNTSTLGSLSQFIAISTHPTDASVTLGGTQDNGSPATAAGQTAPPLPPPLWFEANGGDGGFNTIDHTGNNWYTANTDVSVQKCTSGTSCIETAFFNASVGSAQVGGDHGAFYTPYLLDPNDDADVIVGTCRVWRGVANVPPTNLTALSNNFDTGTAAVCTGNENNLVASLAAGGPVDGSGLSKVIYAGTAAGKIFVTTNASGGVGTWVDETGTTNPGGFPVSGAALDKADATGQTAYITIQGFTGGTGHVWKTTNAGGAWTDITGNLPDAPVNSILIDPSNRNLVYVGTDVGVFVTTNPVGGATWNEYGTGLPNVAVFSLAAGHDDTLRAGTHGRGVFEISLASGPTYTLSISNTPQTVYPSQLPAIFNGTATAINGYNNTVNLSCIAGATPPPSTCTPSPNPVTPSATGAPFTVSTSDVVADYSFNLKGVGTDPNNVTQTVPITLHIVDFNLTGFSTTTPSIPVGSSATVTFQATAAGSFSGTVTLSCSGLPAGMSCSFAPAATVRPTSGSPVNVTLTISTTSTLALGSYPISVVGTPGSPAGPAKQQALTASVQSFTLSASPASQTVTAGGSAPYTLTATPVSGSFGSAITFACSGLPQKSSCSFNPMSVTPGGTAANTTLTISTTATQGTSLRAESRRGSWWPWALALPLPGLILVGVGGRRSRRAVLLAVVLGLLALGLLVGCGGSSSSAPPPPNPGTPPGTYTITVTGSAGSLTKTTTVSLKVQ